MHRRHIALSLRIGLALFSTLASVGLAFMLLTGVHQVHSATSVNEIPLPGAQPWGLGFDRQGNIWVAEPGCVPNPVCSVIAPGAIAEVNRSTFTVVHNFAEPDSTYSSPLFLAIDAYGNIWFSEPMTNSIGELIPGPTPTWHQWTVPTAQAAPFDLAFDQYGHLWFTEMLANQIGEFDPSTQQFYETPTPSANSNPYGIIGPEPTTGKMWFTENNSAVARIASFTPPPAGKLATSGISEYLTRSGGSTDTPHLITFDGRGNMWWTEGWDGKIGQLVISQAQPGTGNGVTEFTVPTCSCSTHISGIGVDGAGNVWFDDSLSARVGYFIPGTHTFTMLPFLGGSASSNAHPHDGLAVASDNTVYFAEEFADKLGEVLQPGVPLPPPRSTSLPISISPTATDPSIPVNKTWYFAEGRVGKGFQEYLTIDNPSPTSCAVNIAYNYTLDNTSSPLNQIVTVTVPPTSRLTEAVNADLRIPNWATPAAIVAVVGQVSSTTPACPGVVMERPMYFHTFRGIASGDDVVGATHLNTSYYFADTPTGPDNASFITILNPNTASATVTANYYANGQMVGTQKVTVPPNARGTITPNLIALPAHVAAVVTSTQPVMVERPSYFINGAISGGYDVVGVSSLANDWLFAEGYTGSSTQEYLTIANVDPSKTAANVTITLESKTGSTKSYTLPLSPMSQTIWNVNANNTFPGSSPEVSIEVTSTGANIVVQREMYFQYHHTLYTGRVTQSVGGTDVIGQVGPASHSVYSFAEGYTNAGYNEWLTVQNPTATNITISVTLVNGYGRSYTTQFPVNAHSRFTQDITTLVLQNMVHQGDDHRGYEVSMTVQSLGGTPITVERPMYWNTAGSSFASQGGSDVIGYVGG
jgi:streptogramin lyase